MNDLIWIEISKSAIRHNVGVFRRLAGKNAVLAPCVKSNAYGHGMVDIAKLALKAGADWLCVNSIDEAKILRKSGIRRPVLVIGFIQKKDLAMVAELDVRAAVYNDETAIKLSKIAGKKNKNLKIHIKIDTGMSRQGVLSAEALKFIRRINKLPNLEIEGLMTHYACADDPKNPSCFRRQLDNYSKLMAELEQAGIKIKLFHTANSAASLLYKESRYNFIRPGISIYGYYPDKSVEPVCRERNIILKPTLTLKTRVAQVKTITKGSTVSYGCTFTAKRKTKIAVLPIGYYDGIDRKLSNKGEVLIKGSRARILGRVCMNIFVVDITGIENVKPEDEVVIIGKQGKERITVEEVADKIGTINYEITTRLRESIIRKYI